jgi:hypothetical protein
MSGQVTEPFLLQEGMKTASLTRWTKQRQPLKYVGRMLGLHFIGAAAFCHMHVPPDERAVAPEEFDDRGTADPAENSSRHGMGKQWFVLPDTLPIVLLSLMSIQPLCPQLRVMFEEGTDGSIDLREDYRPPIPDMCMPETSSARASLHEYSMRFFDEYPQSRQYWSTLEKARMSYCFFLFCFELLAALTARPEFMANALAMNRRRLIDLAT